MGGFGIPLIASATGITSWSIPQKTSRHFRPIVRKPNLEAYYLNAPPTDFLRSTSQMSPKVPSYISCEQHAVGRTAATLQDNNYNDGIDDNGNNKPPATKGNDVGSGSDRDREGNGEDNGEGDEEDNTECNEEGEGGSNKVDGDSAGTSYTIEMRGSGSSRIGGNGTRSGQTQGGEVGGHPAH
ncbi:hypothetical protein HOY80DRAFT_1059192 [Tuber brumale]|nr:hypothetical protein HOY80DRAFT_1059192 [Tuber brumale]